MTLISEEQSSTIERLNPIDVDKVVEKLSNDLPEIAQSLMLDGSRRIDMTEPLNVAFFDSPDDPDHHSRSWHQHGIVTHSREFARAMHDEIPDYLEKWGVADDVNEIMSEEIDGVAKKDLLTIASLLHDNGKFTARKVEYSPSGNAKYHFDEHAEHSGANIREDLRTTLTEQGLSDTQIEYVATCAELHFELGEVRKAAKKRNQTTPHEDTTVGGYVLKDYLTQAGGYTLNFAESPEFAKAAKDIITKNPTFATEIGLLFIADGLSKSEVMAVGTTDLEISMQRSSLQKELSARHLDANLIQQAMQMPVNLKIAEKYLGFVVQDHRSTKEQVLERQRQQDEKRDVFNKHLVGHKATLAARNMIDGEDVVQIRDALTQRKNPDKKGSHFKYPEAKEYSEVTHEYDVFVEIETSQKTHDYAQSGYYSGDSYRTSRGRLRHTGQWVDTTPPSFNSARPYIDLRLQFDAPGGDIGDDGEPLSSAYYQSNSKLLNALDVLNIPIISGGKGARDTSVAWAKKVETTAPNSLRIIGFANGLEIIDPQQLHDWQVRLGTAPEGGGALPIHIMSQPKDYAMDLRWLEEQILTEGKAVIRPVETQEEDSLRKQYYDDNRMKNVFTTKDGWLKEFGEDSAELHHVKFSTGGQYYALVLKHINADGELEKLAIAENPITDNAAFVVSPDEIPEDATWLDILTLKTKPEAEALGADREVHVGNWQARLAEYVEKFKRR